MEWTTKRRAGLRQRPEVAMEWTKHTSGDEHWQVRPDWRNRLFSADELRLREWDAEGVLQTVKTGPHRTLYCVRLSNTSLFIKHYPKRRWISWIRRKLRLSKSRIECDHALAVTACRVRTIEPLAFGETTAGESYLITQGVEGAQSLDQFLRQAESPMPSGRRHRLRMVLTDQLARLFARMHAAGVLHGDIHPGNILVQSLPDGRLRLYLIDLQSIQASKPVSWKESISNIIVFNRWAMNNTCRADRRRFWRRYIHYRQAGLSRVDERRQAKEIEKRTAKSCQGQWRRRERGFLRVNRRFYRAAGGNHEAWAARDLAPSDLNEVLRKPDALFDHQRILKDGRSSTVVEFPLPIQGNPTAVIFKRFNVTKLGDPWISLFRPNPAKRAWINGHAFLERGLPTARPLALIQRRRFGLIRECYLLTEKINTATDLHACLEDLGRQPPANRRKQTLLLGEKLAHLVRSLHLKQCSIRDLKSANLLVRVDPIDGPQLHFIDLAGVHRRRMLSRHRKVQNLARLNISAIAHPWISRTDRLRFLRTYMAWGLHGKRGWKDWWRQIAQVTQAKIIQNQRRGRCLI